MIIDVDKTGSEDLYKLLIGSVLPRPIAWVSSISADGVPNLAPFSFFTVASSNPPILCFSPALKEAVVDGKVLTVPKDTLRNVKETGEFVVNVVSRPVAEKMVQTSGEYAAGVNEFDAAGLTAVPSKMVRPPRVGESLINMECKLHQILEFGHHPGAGSLILGRILCFHLDDSVYKSGHVELDVLQPIGRLSGAHYCTIKDRFEMQRPRIEQLVE